ncbi:SLAM family member 6 isoform X2 [Zalophus californianus]|uniref:SLAM family member 6 isoform X2 n=1 Tax=Zalophus californianus TaxID=9704 RepID=A0A6P9EUT1_ZALCA|nr:SLAM family member 6 isoform X2 [Zalophus californianus]
MTEQRRADARHPGGHQHQPLPLTACPGCFCPSRLSSPSAQVNAAADSGNTASQDSSNPLTVNGVLGESVTLSLKLPVHQDIQSITWLHNGKSINFILPKAAPDLRISVTDPKRKDRLQLMENYSLQLSNLATADAGLYCAQITTQTSTEFSYYTLQVFRRLRNLQIANHTWLSEIGTCEIHLTCSVENSNDTFLRWQVVGNTSINEANLTISWDPRNSSEQKFTCIAENTVSNISFSVSTQSLCEGVLNMKNHPDTKWIIIVVVVTLICIVITVGLLVWRKKDCLWRTGIFHFSTPQTQSPETIRNLDYVSISPGNTVYACVTHPNRQTNIPTPVKSSDFSTIYSTVHQYKESKPISSRTTALDNVI